MNKCDTCKHLNRSGMTADCLSRCLRISDKRQAAAIRTTLEIKAENVIHVYLSNGLFVDPCEFGCILWESVT